MRAGAAAFMQQNILKTAFLIKKKIYIFKKIVSCPSAAEFSSVNRKLRPPEGGPQRGMTLESHPAFLPYLCLIPAHTCALRHGAGTAQGREAPRGCLQRLHPSIPASVPP